MGSLSESEQLYWKSFNIIPDGTFSETAYKRFFLAEFAEAETLDLVFKNMFTEFQEKWHKKYGWHLFKPLNKGDEYHFSGLRIPIKDTQVEFDSQVLSLTKIMIDSLNEKELTKVISQDVADMKGISKFEQYLIISEMENYQDHVLFLRNLQNLRSSGSAHRKSKNYIKAAKVFKLDQESFVAAFAEILGHTIDLLNYCEEQFL